MDGFDFFAFVSQFGLPFTMACLALITVLRGDWVPKRIHEREIELVQRHFQDVVTRLEGECREWRGIALKSVETTEEAAKLHRQLLEAK